MPVEGKSQLTVDPFPVIPSAARDPFSRAADKKLL